MNRELQIICFSTAAIVLGQVLMTPNVRLRDISGDGWSNPARQGPAVALGGFFGFCCWGCPVFTYERTVYTNDKVPNALILIPASAQVSLAVNGTLLLRGVHGEAHPYLIPIPQNIVTSETRITFIHETTGHPPDTVPKLWIGPLAMAKWSFAARVLGSILQIIGASTLFCAAVSCACKRTGTYLTPYALLVGLSLVSVLLNSEAIQLVHSHQLGGYWNSLLPLHTIAVYLTAVFFLPAFRPPVLRLGFCVTVLLVGVLDASTHLPYTATEYFNWVRPLVSLSWQYIQQPPFAIVRLICLSIAVALGRWSSIPLVIQLALDVLLLDSPPLLVALLWVGPLFFHLLMPVRGPITSHNSM